MIKKFLFIALAILLISGIAEAAGIPVGVDPLNAPEIWTTEVYNNSGAALTSGAVVVWDMGSDTGDASYAYRTSWVTTTATADDINVAGVVVSPSIAITEIGTIAIRGPVYAIVNDSSDAVTANQVVGTTGTARRAGGAVAGANSGLLGWCIYAAPVAVANGGYGGTDDRDFIMIPIFVDPTIMTN